MYTVLFLTIYVTDASGQLNTIFAVPTQPEEVEPQSVIHAPTGFGKFVSLFMQYIYVDLI